MGKRRPTAVAYIRTSTWGQKDGDSIPRQERAIEAYAKEHGIHVPAWHYDVGISGGDAPQDRPGLMSAFASAKIHGATMLLAEAWDRVARGTLPEMLAAAESVGVRITVVGDWPATIDPDMGGVAGMTSSDAIAECLARVENASTPAPDDAGQVDDAKEAASRLDNV